MADARRLEKSIFLDALERPPGERASFLDRACRGDPALRAGVEALLRAHDEPPRLLDTQDAGPASGLPAAGPPGATIGPYELVRRLGEGGMGTVFLAEQTEPVRREVALKIIRPGLDTRQVLARFGAERQALAVMDHPNIAKVLDAGATPDGRPFFVMELVQGVAITKFCDGRRLGLRERLGLFVQVCAAVQHAHQKGVIHRDLKPSNVLVAEYDGKPAPKVIDFGVAKAAGTGPDGWTGITEVGQVVGTLEYMSPEQAGLNPLDIDTRSDVYSLGVLLYELLTGSTPIPRDRLRGSPLLESLRLVREHDPPKPSARAAGAPADGRRAPRWYELDWIVMKCLEKDRARRYATAHELARDVERLLRHEPVHAGPPSAWYRFGKFARRNRVALTVAGSVGVVLVAATAALAVAAARLAREEQAKTAALGKETAALGKERDALAKEREANDGLRKTLSRHRIALAHREWLANNVARAEELLDECPAELRRWEWHYLKRLCHGERLTYRVDPPPLGGVASSPDGKRLATVDRDRRLSVRDAATGGVLLTLRGHDGPTRAVAFSPDGKHLASAGADRAVKTWDLATGREARTLLGHREEVGCVAFGPDGRVLASGSLDGTVRVWDLTTGQPVHSLGGRLRTAQWVAFSPDGSLLAAAGLTDRGPSVQVWDARSGREVRALAGMRTVAFGEGAGRNGPVLAAPAEGGAVIKLWDATTGKELAALRGHSSIVNALAFSADGRYLASGTSDRTVKVWDVAAGLELRTYRGHANVVGHVALSPAGDTLTAVEASGVVKVWDAAVDQEARTFRRPASENICDLAFGPDGRWRVVSAARGELGVWDLAAGRELVARGPVAGSFVRLSSDGGRVTWASPDRVVTVCDVATGRSVGTWSGPRLVGATPALSPDGRRLAIWGEDRVLRVWDLPDRREVAAIPTSGVGVEIAFSPTGRMIAFWAYEGAVGVRDLEDGRDILALPQPPRSVVGLRFSPDGRHLAWGTVDSTTVKVIDLTTKQEAFTLRGPGSRVQVVAFSPDGARLAAGTTDSVIWVWELETGQEVLTLRGHPLGVDYLVFTPDGHRLASAAHKDGAVRIWDGTPLPETPRGIAKLATDNR